MKDTVTLAREAEAKKMLRDSKIICGTIIVLTVIIIFIGVSVR